MNEEKVCSRCGSCCRAIVLLKAAMSAESRKYLECHGLKEDQGFFIIPHQCQHLVMIPVPGDYSACPKEYASCDIHESPDRPKVCSRWVGQRRIGNQLIYCPPGCVYHKDRKEAI